MASLLTRPGPPSDAAAPDPGPDGRPAARRPGAPLAERLRLVTVCLAFLGLTLSQQPGRTVADTKLDLTVDPWGFLGRALQLWDPEGFAGQVQDQSYGYLFPMGTFFGLGETVGLPEWVLQRVWMALLLSLAFLGVATLARRLGVGFPGAQLVGGLAYALAPRMLMGLGATSIEVLPMALTPWVLIPLVTGAREGSPRRAAALSGLAVFCVGGVNAVATAAVLPLPVLWLLTRPGGPRRRRLMAWWTASIALATAWWVGPLLLLGRYSPPFLDYIESADTTTAPTGLLSTLRGVTQWMAYLADGGGPVWPTGWALVHDTLPVVATLVLATAGLIGLSRSSMPHRRWLVLGLLAGLILVTTGHLGPGQGLLAGPLHEALDGVLAPMRNVHKFDPVLRLPLALGVAHVSGLLFDRMRRPAPGGILARAGAGLLVACLVTTASPAVAGRLSPPTGFESIPGYWQQTADWLARAQPSGRALLLPASSYGTYLWGSTSDEPLQALAESPWTVRSAIPLSDPGHVRMLDAVEERIARGEGSAGLARYLARAGISYLVVRNDLDAGKVASARPILAAQALDDSPGLRRVAWFGPVIPTEQTLFGQVLDAYLTPRRPAVEIYAVDDPAPRAYTTPLADAVTVLGGPDAVLALEDRGVLTDRPALLPDGTTGAAATTMVSDAQLRRERNYGRIDDAVSNGLTASDPLRLDRVRRDYTYPGAEFGESVVRLDGATVTASSSASDADSVGGTRVEDQPFAAMDGDPATAWRPAVRIGETGAVWWRIDVDRPISARSIVVRLADDRRGNPPAPVRIRTDVGQRTVRLAGTSRPQHLTLPAGSTSSLEIGADGPAAADLALAEVEIPGLSVSRTVVTPATDRPVAVYAFDAASPARPGCAVESPGQPRCATALVRGPEEPRGIDREFTVGTAADYRMRVTVVPRAGAALDALIGRAAHPGGPTVTASSAAVPDPRAGADAAVDGDLRTAWVADPADPRPSLTLTWPEPRTIDRLRLETTVGTAASVPTVVAVGTGGLEQVIPLDLSGVATFAPILTDRLTVSFPQREERSSFDPYTHEVSTLGVGISELDVDGSGPGDAATPVVVPCGQGPVVQVDGVARQTSLRTTPADLRAMRPVELQPCGDGAATTGVLAPGRHRFLAGSTAAFAVTAATLTRTSSPATAEPGRRTGVEVGTWGREHRTLRVGQRSEPTLLVVPENANRGWVATLGGRVLEARTVDGWQQGYVLPPGPGADVTLDFRPGRAYHAVLLTGAAALLALLALLRAPARRAVPAAGVRRRSRAGAVLFLTCVVAGTALVGGIPGLLALVAVGGLARAAGARREPALAVLAALALLGAGAVSLTAGGAGGAQVLASIAVAAVLVAVRPLAGVSRTTERQRRSGRSTST